MSKFAKALELFLHAKEASDRVIGLAEDAMRMLKQEIVANEELQGGLRPLAPPPLIVVDQALPVEAKPLVVADQALAPPAQPNPLVVFDPALPAQRQASQWLMLNQRR
ncbi:uncharacterized protein [Drosophila tropicalis]|uniref:uncharacterized protein n=1 Tax=Drosophila tropicalis TaxID=46794 RepID=UPI0035AC011E